MTPSSQTHAPGTPQEAIFVEGTSAHWFQHFATRSGVAASEVLVAVRTTQEVAAAAGVQLVLGFGAEMTGRPMRPGNWR